jgi:type II pantothenate kinase
MANPFRGEGYQSGDSLGTETGAAGPGTAGPGARPGELAPGAEGRTAQPADRTGVRGDPGAEVSIGVDWGATLAKLAVQRRGEPPEFRLLPCAEPKACSRVLEELHALTEPDDVRIGVTGGGADRLTRELPGAVAINEFAAWGAGGAHMLAATDAAPAQRYLLVSVGTGTSVLLVDGSSVTRVGGTALGGGTLLGLAAGLIGGSDFAQIAKLARSGSRKHVDLLVSDIYPAGGIALAGDLTAANFGKLAPRLVAGDAVADADIAHALMGLLGENIALVCAGLAAVSRVQRIVFGGSTLAGNDALVEILGGITRTLGREPLFLPHGEYAGALGALLLRQERGRGGKVKN